MRKISINSLIIVLILILITCVNSNKNRKMNSEASTFNMGSYGFDIDFLSKNNIEFIELEDENSGAKLVLIPSLQGRVLTSTAAGDSGKSFGWINYKHIESGIVNEQFNPFGGEERLWFGPEGGPFSIYFEKGEKQNFENWKVPSIIDTESFDVIEKSRTSAKFQKTTIINNSAGNEFEVEIERTVSILSKENISSILNVEISDELNVVAYQSDNKIKNISTNAWNKETGMLSIWMLCMFSPSETTTVFIPFEAEENTKIVNDEYFGKVPSERLIVENDAIYFKIDGKFRSKIGVPPGRAKNLCGSYDSAAKQLTLVWCTIPEDKKEYVNSNWGEQSNPFDGDVINSYNDGPVDDGSIMGPFYEIETSSPAASLKPLESLVHTQRVMHFQGDENQLSDIVRKLFNLDLKDISNKFVNIK